MYLIKVGFKNFFRNFWLSFSVVVILILMFFSISFLLILNNLIHQILNSVEKKIDFSLYLKPEITENELNNLKNDLENLNQVEEVKIITPVEVLERFKEKHKNEPEILKSIEEINFNPFGPALLVKIKPNSDVDQIFGLITSPFYENFIQEKDFTDYQELMNKVNLWGRKIKFFALIVSGIFILVAFLVIFNSVRLSIFARLEEIRIMRLLGATDWFIRAPFLIELFICILTAFLINTGLILFLVFKFQSQIASFLNFELNLFNYLTSNSFFFFGGQFIFGLIGSWLAASLAMNKYLKM
jgi:cell division transport system permease protein